ncbi:MAG: hypothetical protein IANPNBLG_02437 [Bryobacteraceae bacterium]|nr:hypothetical protein [Bryobacteraceae bacterium]
MPQFDLDRMSVAEFLERFRPEMVPLSHAFSYFFAGLPLTEEDIKEYLEEPIAALPPSIVKSLPKAQVVLVPFLEKSNGKGGKRHGPISPGSREYILLDKPPENKASTHFHYRGANGADLVFAVKDTDLADYHYYFFHEIAALAEVSLSEEVRVEYHAMLGDELGAHVHGEVDEQSWHLKQGLRRRSSKVRRDTKAFHEYARLSFIDTLTLYIHGICCDIDVETGPRQLPSRVLRKRLMWFETAFPPPQGYAVFPEELDAGPPPNAERA